MGRLELEVLGASMDDDRGSILDVSEDATEDALVAEPPIDVEMSVLVVSEDAPETVVEPDTAIDVEMGSIPVVSENDPDAKVVVLPEIPVDVEVGFVLAVSESVAMVVAVTLPEMPMDVEVGSALAVSDDAPEALPKTPLDVEMGSVPVVSESVVKVVAVTLRVVVEVVVLLTTPLLTLLGSPDATFVDALTKVCDVVVPTGVIVIRVVSPSREMTVVGRSIVVLEVGEVAGPL